MSEPKFKIGDKVRCKNISGIFTIEGLSERGEPRYFLSAPHLQNPFIASESELGPIEDTPKPCHKKIIIKVKLIEPVQLLDGYEVVEVDALSWDELPDEYKNGFPRVFKYQVSDELHVADKDKAFILEEERFLTTQEWAKIKSICAAAGKRLHDINKRKREKAKIETWEW